jgi:hypothetical protein
MGGHGGQIGAGEPSACAKPENRAMRRRERGTGSAPMRTRAQVGQALRGRALGDYSHNQIFLQ